MSCTQTILDYGLRAIGYGERLLPRSDFTLCQQFTLIGSGMIWNIYFGLFALMFGFCFAVALAMGKDSPKALLRKTPPNGSFLYSADHRSLFSSFSDTSSFYRSNQSIQCSKAFRRRGSVR